MKKCYHICLHDPIVGHSQDDIQRLPVVKDPRVLLQGSPNTEFILLMVMLTRTMM